MLRFYKILIFVLFLLVLGAIFLYFSPVSKKEIEIEERGVSAIEDAPTLIQENSSFTENNEEKTTEKTINPTIQKEVIGATENEIDADSMKIIQKLVSWGYSKPQSTRTIDTIIIHSSYNALGGDPYSVDKLINEYREYGVSPHYLIDREGNVYQLVNNENIAYHAGESKMPDGRTNVNNFSLGIEIINNEDSKPTEKQYQSLNELISFIKNNHQIKNILGHNQIAPGRKTDPWNFDWKKL